MRMLLMSISGDDDYLFLSSTVLSTIDNILCLLTSPLSQHIQDYFNLRKNWKWCFYVNKVLTSRRKSHNNGDKSSYLICGVYTGHLSKQLLCHSCLTFKEPFDVCGKGVNGEVHHQVETLRNGWCLTLSLFLWVCVCVCAGGMLFFLPHLCALECSSVALL